MPQFLNHVIYSNTVLKYLLFLASLIICFVVIRIIGCIFIRHLARHAGKTGSSDENLLTKSLKRYVIPAAYVTAFYLSTKILVISPGLTELIDAAALALITVMAALFASSILVLIFNKYWETKRKDANRELAVKTVSGLIKIVIWVVAVILFLDNIGIKINTLIAGVGIGGIAVAFAAQAILGDIFCFFTIFFDRPFEIGDFIVAGEQMGTVEYIGLKTTRLRALNGEQLIFSNTDLTGSRIQNYKTMEQRRVLFSINVTYDTPSEKLSEIPLLIKGIIDGVPDTSFGRAHLASFGEYGLKFETAYFVLSSDYDKYMDIHQEVNLRIKAAFDKHGIAFALPLRAVTLSTGTTSAKNRLEG